ncbi:spermatogenesis-associated protein 6-like isoform X2 [Mytilus californianus]|uniref:spermatogenesis-associated protein 6-like isoform X2 n=1 Tax=Mytilus californianus TaxID=6549 RepID=UPI002246FECC|nr:spermatogenesis-associated protein 6-like isoform X2 [Mytilus californianus]
MPRRALRCVVDLKIRAVSAPGVWLSSREDVYLSISLFGQYRNTNLVPSIFPLLFKEDFVFEKTYYTALDPSDISDYLEDELVIFELLQLSEYCDGAVRLGSYSCNAKDFLFPYPSLAPCYASTAREILLNRTIDFPGISPKLEFITVTNIKESVSPELDALDEALMDARKSRRRSRSRSRSRPSSRASMRTFVHVEPEEKAKSYHRPTVSSVCHSRSPSPYLRSKSPGPITDNGRPPFVVRHLDKSLIGRLPAGLGSSILKKGKKKGKRLSRPSSAMSDTALGIRSSSPKACYVMSEDKCSVCKAYRRHMGKRYWGHSPTYHPTGLVMKKKYPDAGDDPLYRSSYAVSDDDDLEVAALTSSLNRIRARSRSPSPFVYKPSFRSRYTYSPLTAAERVDLKVRSALRRNRSLERLNMLSPAISLSRLTPTYRPRYVSLSRDSLDDLAIDTTLAERRRPQVHLDNGKYWSEKSAQYSGTSHRQVFNDSLSSSYSKMYSNAKKKIVV